VEGSNGRAGLRDTTAADDLDRLFRADPAAIADPHPIYARIRAEDPVHWSDELGAWIVTRHADVIAGLRDPRLSANRNVARLMAIEADESERAQMLERASLQMINSDPPEHGRRRELVGAAFHPRVIESYREPVTDAADALLDAVVETGEMDFIADYGFPLPMTIITGILGVPFRDGPQIKAWADGVSNFLSSSQVGRAEAESYLSSWASLAEYLRSHLGADRDGAADDVLGQLAIRIRDGDTTEDEAVANLVLLSVAGHETTTNTAGMALLTLLRYPDELARLRSDPSLTESAVEELLRYEPTASWDFRVAATDFELHGRSIRAGQLVNFVLAAANRDPAVFPEPDRLDLGRQPNRHVTFGQGAHFCLGSQLARLELGVAISTFLRRIEAFQMIDPAPDWKPNIRMRGLRSLRLSIRPSA
jgi:cytochrome P450